MEERVTAVGLRRRSCFDPYGELKGGVATGTQKPA